MTVRRVAGNKLIRSKYNTFCVPDLRNQIRTNFCFLLDQRDVPRYSRYFAIEKQLCFNKVTLGICCSDFTIIIANACTYPFTALSWSLLVSTAVTLAREQLGPIIIGYFLLTESLKPQFSELSYTTDNVYVLLLQGNR